MGKLPYETIIAAIQGDKGAIEEVLKGSMLYSELLHLESWTGYAKNTIA
jgi:hypothetical protein